MTRIIAALSAVLMFGVCHPADGTVYSWQSVAGVDGGDFNDPTHWSPTGGPPLGPSSDASIGLQGAGAFSISVTFSPSFGGLSLDSPNVTLDDRAQNFTTASDSFIEQGKVILTGSLWKNNGGAITQTIDIESPAYLTANSFATVWLNLINNGTVEVDGSLSLTAGTTTTTNNSNFTVESGATLNITNTFTQVAGSLSISGLATASATGAVFNYNGGSLSGTVLFTGSTLNLGAGAGNSGSFNFQFNNTLTGNVLLGQTATVQSTDANGAAFLSWKTNGFTNAGQIVLTSTGSTARNTTLSVAAGNTLTNTGEIDFQAGVGGTRFLTADVVNNSGTLNVNAATNLNGVSSPLNNSGHIHIATGTTLNLSSGGAFTQTAGETQDDGALVVTPSTGDIKIQGGILHGTGSVTGKLQVSGNGQIAPGESIGTLSIAGNTSFSGGSLAAELGATGSPGTSDLLAVTGNLTLSGTSTLSLSGGAPGGYYTIVTYSGSLTGTFNSVTAGYSVDYSHAGVIQVISAMRGDFNRDGQITAADIPAMLTALTDLNQFKARNGLSDSDLVSIGDIDGSGSVTNADINALIGLLRSGGGSLAAVPEPRSIVLLALALPGLAFAVVRRRDCSSRYGLELCE